MVINRGILAVFLALAGQHQYANAFTPPLLPSVGSRSMHYASTMSAVESDTDVSIPYDAAARLSYDNWCSTFNKEPSDTKYETFKTNYETITVANVVTAKEAQDKGTARGKDLELNEYGDMTEAEYMAMQSGGSAPAPAEEEEVAPNKGALESAMEATMAQSEASSALVEAADALAEEEKVSCSYPSFWFVAFMSTAISYISTYQQCTKIRNLQSNWEWTVSKNSNRQSMQWRVLISMVVKLTRLTYARHVSDRHILIGVKSMERLPMNLVSQHSLRTFWLWRSMPRGMVGR